MKIAIVSDIQGNAFALHAALEHIKRVQPDIYVCLGDIVTGPQPRRCLQLLQEVNCRIVQGNMDVAVLNPVPYDGNNTDEQFYSEIDHWCYSQLSEDDRSYMASFSPKIEIDTPSDKLLCVHGSPGSYNDVIDATTSEDELTRMLGDMNFDLLAVGHMHTPMLRTFKNITIFNPGSIGLPYGAKQLMPCRAQYAILQTGSLNFHTIDYDPVAFEKGLLQSRMPHAEWYAAKWQIK